MRGRVELKPVQCGSEIGTNIVYRDNVLFAPSINIKSTEGSRVMDTMLSYHHNYMALFIRDKDKHATRVVLYFCAGNKTGRNLRGIKSSSLTKQRMRSSSRESIMRQSYSKKKSLRNSSLSRGAGGTARWKSLFLWWLLCGGNCRISLYRGGFTFIITHAVGGRRGRQKGRQPINNTRGLMTQSSV